MGTTAQPAADKATDFLARAIIKHISDAALELAFVRHSLTSDEVDCDDDADIATRVAAIEEFAEDVKRDTLNCLTGDDTGCLDESELDESNCELLWLKSVLRTCPLNQSAAFAALVSALNAAQSTIESMHSENKLHGHITDASAFYLHHSKPLIDAALAQAAKAEETP